MSSEAPIQMIQTLNIVSDGAHVQILSLFSIERVTRKKNKAFLLYIYLTSIVKKKKNLKI